VECRLRLVATLLIQTSTKPWQQSRCDHILPRKHA
jgi:hypothetical protein